MEDALEDVTLALCAATRDAGVTGTRLGFGTEDGVLIGVVELFSVVPTEVGSQ